MTTQAEQDVINQTKSANRSGGRKATKGAPKSVDTQAGMSNVQTVLDKARNDVRKGAKAHILGGISDALIDIKNGDFGESGDEIIEIVEDFGSLFSDLEDASRFQLSPASESKKMLASADVIDVK